MAKPRSFAIMEKLMECETCNVSILPVPHLLSYCTHIRIFEIAPGAKALFPFAKKNENDDDEEMFKNPRFLMHARRVVKMLDVAVDMLGPDLGPVSHALKLLGERHVAYGVIPDHYPIVGQALLATLEAALGSSWTPQVQEGWAAIYGFVSATMVAGATSQE
jgi:hemoglobin-like flavoprotein